MEFICECNSDECTQIIDIDLTMMMEIRKKGYIIISNNCEHGPEPTDVFIIEKDGYKVYKEQS